MKESAMSVQNGIYLNGRKQAIDLLLHLNAEEKAILIGFMKIKNPTLALDLAISSFNFLDLINLTDGKLSTVLNHTSSTVIAYALHALNNEEKKRWLGNISRDKAVDTFDRHRKASPTKAEIEKACAKVTQIAKDLIEARVIQILK